MGLPVLASEHGRDVDSFIVYVHWLMLALFVGWLSFFFLSLFKFSRKRHPKADYVGVKGHASNYVELIVVGAEAFLLIACAIPLWAKVVEEFPSDKDATVIKVTAQQFAWNSRYAGKDGVFGRQDIKLRSAENQFGIDKNDPQAKDDIVPPLNEIVVPVNKPVVIHLTSLDVIHSFALRAFRICQDAIPGMSIPVHFKPVREGKYLITCAQLCGNSHYFMRGYFTVLSPEKYDQWVAEKSAASAAPTSFE